MLDTSKLALLDLYERYSAHGEMFLTGPFGFAHLKRILRLGRLRLRGPCGARDEFLLAATAQNLRKLAKLIIPPTPLPAT
jgi:hypothetical protein